MFILLQQCFLLSYSNSRFHCHNTVAILDSLMMTKRALHVCCINHSNLELHLVGKILLIKVSIVTQNSLPESTIIVDPKNCICCTSWLVVIHWNPLNFMKIPCTILFQKNFRKSNVPFWQVKAIKIVCVLVLKKPFRLNALMLSQQSFECQGLMRSIYWKSSEHHWISRRHLFRYWTNSGQWRSWRKH